MTTRFPRFIVSGLHRGGNLPPGAGLVRSLRRAHPNAFIVGLSYGLMEHGSLSESGADTLCLMPLPAAGPESCLQGLDHVLAHAPADILVPTMDAEVELLAGIAHEIARRGVLTCLPDQAMLSRRAKSRLPTLARDCAVKVADTRGVYGILGAVRAAAELGYPVMVKGRYYEAKKVCTEAAFITEVTRLLAEWGAPAIVQRCIPGRKIHALGIGDGQGGMAGLCCTCKPAAGATHETLCDNIVVDPLLKALCTALIGELKWRGPFDIEVIQNDISNEYSLIDFHPLLPAWIDHLSEWGTNLVRSLIAMMTDETSPGFPGEMLRREIIPREAHQSPASDWMA